MNEGHGVIVNPKIKNLAPLYAKFRNEVTNARYHSPAQFVILNEQLHRAFSWELSNVVPPWKCSISVILERLLPSSSEEFYRFMRHHRINFIPHETSVPVHERN